jgi:peptidyl-prolyl cis-trans isomerase A (cyclophilin A)
MTRSLVSMLVPAALIIAAFLPGCESSREKTESSATAPPTYKPTPPAPKPAEPAKPPVQAANTSAKPATKPANTQVVIDTNTGKIVVELDDNRTPVTVKNFLQYVDDKFYDGTIIHRVEHGFVIQGGGFDESLKEKATRSPITNEAAKGRKNARGTIAMARTPDPNSATSQFYINLKANTMLDGGYCAFGRVIEGMDVVDKIGAARTENLGGAFATIPADRVVIRSIRRK